jgi:hypothetical protein
MLLRAGSRIHGFQNLGRGLRRERRGFTVQDFEGERGDRKRRRRISSHRQFSFRGCIDFVQTSVGDGYKKQHYHQTGCDDKEGSSR